MIIHILLTNCMIKTASNPNLIHQVIWFCEKWSNDQTHILLTSI